MCPMCDGMTEDEYDLQMLDKIEKYGWAIQAVEGTDSKNPTFAYTVGLTTIDHPELIVFGMDFEDAAVVLNHLARQAFVFGCRLSEDHPIDTFFTDINPEPHLLDFPDSSTHLLLANYFYRVPGAPPLPALQVMWSDDATSLNRAARRALRRRQPRRG